MSVSDAGKAEAATGVRRFEPYPAYKDSGAEWLGAIPTHWDAAKTWRISDATSGATPAKEERGFWDGDIPWVSPKDMKRRFIQSSEDTITERALAETGIKLIAPPVVLIVVRGMILAHTFPVAITTVPVTINQDMKALHFRRDVDPVFIAWLFEGLGKGILGAVVEEAAHGTQVIRMDKWRSVIVPVPPVDEQRAIVAFIDRETARIDALVAKKERLIELLQEKRTALITRAVTKGLNPNVPMKDSGVQWLGEIPAHWEVKRLKNLSRFVTSGSRGWAEHYTDEGSLFLRIGNLRTGSIDLDLSDVQHVSPPQGAEGERTSVRSGDLLISITALIGAVGVVPEGIPAAFVNQHLSLVRPSGKRVRSRWLGYCVLSRVGQEQLRAELYGGTKDGLSLDNIRSLVVLVAPSEEQRRIVGILDDAGRHVDALIAKVRDAIGRLRELRTALISAAVTGRIDVREGVA